MPDPQAPYPKRRRICVRGAGPAGRDGMPFPVLT